MENPLEQPAPEDPIQRVKTLARDLAYGAVNGMWNSRINLSHEIGDDSEHLEDALNLHSSLSGYIQDKWKEPPPSIYLLESFEYVELVEIKDYCREYSLTSRAFALLEAPLTTPSVFISYKHDQSSALALLIEARLKLTDRNINVFVDKQLEAGDIWHGKLEEKVRECRYFICLTAPRTLESSFVRKEIDWALDSGSDCRVICHNGYQMDGSHPLSDMQAIAIKEENAEEYELAMIKLINSLGYSTI